MYGALTLRCWNTMQFSGIYKEKRVGIMAQNIQKDTASFLSQIKKHVPGIAAVMIIAAGAVMLSRFIGEQLMGFDESPVSSVMISLLMGIILGNLFTLPAALQPGIRFSVKTILRIGIALLGLRLSIASAAYVGLTALPLVLTTVIGALLIVTALSRMLKISGTLGTLIAVGTSICGVSAIAAAGPAIDASDEEMSYAVTTITVFGMAALVVYPVIAYWVFRGDGALAGYFLGTAVHDTSQVTGAALMYAQVYGSPEVLEIAMVTKLLRNLLMAVLIPYISLKYSRSKMTASSGLRNSLKYIPGFVIWFAALSAVRTLGDLSLQSAGNILGVLSSEAWTEGISFLSSTAVFLLVAALAAVGLRTSLKDLAVLGVKPFLTGFAAAAVVGLLSTAFLYLVFPLLQAG